MLVHRMHKLQIAFPVSARRLQTRHSHQVWDQLLEQLTCSCHPDHDIMGPDSHTLSMQVCTAQLGYTVQASRLCNTFTCNSTADCSNSGVCDAATSACTCRAGFIGPDCAISTGLCNSTATVANSSAAAGNSSGICCSTGVVDSTGGCCDSGTICAAVLQSQCFLPHLRALTHIMEHHGFLPYLAAWMHHGTLWLLTILESMGYMMAHNSLCCWPASCVS